MHTYSGMHLNPVLAQSFDMPDWVITPTIGVDLGDGTSINLSLWVCVRDGLAGSLEEPDDELLVGLQNIAHTFITTPTEVADGNTRVSGTSCRGGYAQFETNLVGALLPGENVWDYRSQNLELRLYAPKNEIDPSAPGYCDPEVPFIWTYPNCYETDFYLDDVELDVCTTQPIPPHEPGTAIIGGDLRVFLTGAPLPKQGVRVWAYKQNGELLTTYSLHDSRYYFYNLDPGKYVIYSEYWDGPNLYTDFVTVTVEPDEENTGVSLLLR
jgi:hypothetical protein